MGATASGCGGASLPVRTHATVKPAALESTQSQFPQMGGPEITILKFRTERRALPMEAIDHGKPTSRYRSLWVGEHRRRCHKKMARAIWMEPAIAVGGDCT